MRILQLTPGTGSFFCGTCLRDNALVTELRRLGHDALMVPLYLPPALDEAAASPDAPLFYGGVNVYLQQVSSLFRRTPRGVDRIFDSPGMLKMASKRAGMTQAKDLGQLLYSSEVEGVTPRDRLRFWKLYTRNRSGWLWLVRRIAVLRAQNHRGHNERKPQTPAKAA